MGTRRWTILSSFAIIRLTRLSHFVENAPAFADIFGTVSAEASEILGDDLVEDAALGEAGKLPDGGGPGNGADGETLQNNSVRNHCIQRSN